jgi:hypothetical protein
VAAMIMRAFLFVLSLIAVACLYGFCVLLHVPAGWVTLVMSLGVAELLIWRGFRRRGVDEGLWIGGLVAFIVSLPSSGKPEAILAFVAAFALAGARLRNAIFGTIAIVLVIVYCGVKDWGYAPLVAGVAIGIVAAHMTHRSLFMWTTLVAPLTGYLAYRHDAPNLLVVLLFVLVALVDLWIGIRALQRAPLIAGAVAVALVFIEMQEWIDIADEWKLLFAGAALLAIASILMRKLRDRTTGIVVTPMKRAEAFDLLEVAATLPVAADAAHVTATPGRGGGEFGGAGASGDY